MTEGQGGPTDLESVRHAYDTVAEDYATYLPDTSAEAPLDLAMVAAFVEAVGTGPRSRVLDAGCGAGRMTKHLADLGCEVEGLDLSPGMVKQARRHHPELGFVVGSLMDLPYPGSTFAGVLLWYSTIHTPPAQCRQVFTEVARVLQPGGHVLVGFQAGDGVRDVAPAYRPFGHEVELVRHLCTPAEMSAHLRAAGLREVARLVRRPSGSERDDQAFVLATMA